MIDSVTPSAMLKRLGRLPDMPEGFERAMLMYVGSDKLGLNYGISKYLSTHEASIRSCKERLHDSDQIFGSQYVIECPVAAASRISVKEIEDIVSECLPAIRRRKQIYQLAVVGADRKGLLATIEEVLLKRSISILANDVLTLLDAPAETQRSQPEVRIASVRMLLGLEPGASKSALDDLKDGLSYLEHRFGWYIQLTSQTGGQRNLGRHNIVDQMQASSLRGLAN